MITNQLTQSNQVIFTLWDPSATSDMQALKHVFANGGNTFSAANAAWANFMVMITNADGTTRVETLAQAGITSINLAANNVTQQLADGSQISGETTFTKSDGTTGTAASVSFATDAQGYAVTTTTTVNADGSTTIDHKALNSNGITVTPHFYHLLIPNS